MCVSCGVHFVYLYGMYLNWIIKNKHASCKTTKFCVAGATDPLLSKEHMPTSVSLRSMSIPCGSAHRPNNRWSHGPGVQRDESSHAHLPPRILSRVAGSHAREVSKSVQGMYGFLRLRLRHHQFLRHAMANEDFCDLFLSGSI